MRVQAVCVVAYVTDRVCACMEDGRARWVWSIAERVVTRLQCGVGRGGRGHVYVCMHVYAHVCVVACVCFGVSKPWDGSHERKVPAVKEQRGSGYKAAYTHREGRDGESRARDEAVHLRVCACVCVYVCVCVMCVCV